MKRIKKSSLMIINVLLVVAMILHVGISMFIHSQHKDWSAPTYFEIVDAIYYIVPLIIVNIIGFIIRKKAK